jgi:hypothetical protein
MEDPAKKIWHQHRYKINKHSRHIPRLTDNSIREPTPTHPTRNTRKKIKLNFDSCKKALNPARHVLEDTPHQMTSLHFSDRHLIRTGDERERLVTASFVMLKSWGPSWVKQLPGKRPSETAKT